MAFLVWTGTGCHKGWKGRSLMEALYLGSGFALMTFLERPLSYRPAETKDVVRSLLHQCLEILLITLLLVLLGEICPEEIRVLLVMAAAYGAARFFKKENSFFLTVTAFAFSILAPPLHALFEELWEIFRLGFFFLLTRLFLEGLRFRLLFAMPPKRLAGTPVLIFAFSVFLMALSALQVLTH